MKFANMTVAARLSLGFALVILAGLAVAIYGRIQLGRVSDEITLLIDDRIVKVEQVTEIIDNLNINARAMRNMAMLTDEQGMQAEKQRIDEARARNTELLSQLGQSIRSEEGRALLRKVSEVRAPYTQVSDKAIALTQAGRSEEARDVLIKENRPLQSAYFKVLGELIQMQKKSHERGCPHLQGHFQHHRRGDAHRRAAGGTGGRHGGLAADPLHHQAARRRA